MKNNSLKIGMIQTKSNRMALFALPAQLDSFHKIRNFSSCPSRILHNANLFGVVALFISKGMGSIMKSKG
jgi:hypothetical protein